MKNIFHCFYTISCRSLSLTFLCFLGSLTTSWCQNEAGFSAGQIHYDLPDQKDPCITAAQYEQLDQRIKQNRLQLEAEGKLVFPEVSRTPIVLLDWPLTHTADFYDFDYYAVSNFVDHDLDSNSVRDWNCGTRSYDKGTYDHDGMDISIAPAGWNMMSAQLVNVIAAYEGIIVDKNDGAYDLNCSFASSSDANYVIIEHFDGSRANYWHLKNGSVTTKNIGDWVNVGEYLGKVGSSGISTGPHLHFEIKDAGGDLIDPYEGTCNDFNNATWWQDQKPYYEPAILKMITLSSAIVGDTACAAPDLIPEKNHFSDYDPIRLQFFIRDLLPNDSFVLKVYRANNTVKWSYTFQYNGSYSKVSTYFYNGTFGNETAGTWKWEVTFKGKVYARYFTIDCTDHYDLAGAQTGRKGTIAGNYITSISTISSASSNNILYEAENYIRLDPGFQATSGATFLAKIDPCNAGGTLAPISANTDNTVTESKPEPTMLAFPNPFSDELNIVIPPDMIGKEATIKMTDAVGRVFITQNTMDRDEIQLATGSLPDGIYFVILESEGVSIVGKVVK